MEEKKQDGVSMQLRRLWYEETENLKTQLTKMLFAINGGGTVAVLAFIVQLSTAEPPLTELANSMMLAVLWFIVGLVLVVLQIAARLYNIYDFAIKDSVMEKPVTGEITITSKVLFASQIIFCILSLSAFLAGVVTVAVVMY
ncbi:MAG: hypothetical protein HOH19_07100 [Kordiimonadaceae bacterium]|jgi:hypothetical protein|nr:hypothetical protein [Kordiimonadaceae bacterium]MBT6032325.1 hypothetical protein [Kordiimonadaceae bacterium]